LRESARLKFTLRLQMRPLRALTSKDCKLVGESTHSGENRHLEGKDNIRYMLKTMPGSKNSAWRGDRRTRRIIAFRTQTVASSSTPQAPLESRKARSAKKWFFERWSRPAPLLLGSPRKHETTRTFLADDRDGPVVFEAGTEVAKDNLLPDRRHRHGDPVRTTILREISLVRSGSPPSCGRPEGARVPLQAMRAKMHNPVDELCLRPDHRKRWVV